MQLPFSLMYLWFLDRLVRVEGLQLARDSLDSNFQTLVPRHHEVTRGMCIHANSLGSKNEDSCFSMSK